MFTAFHLEQQVATPTVAVRFHAPAGELPSHFQQAFHAIGQYLEAVGEAPVGPPYARYFNFDPDHVEVEAGMPVAHPLAGAGEVVASALPDSTSVTSLHTGPYAALAETYEALTSWIQERGLAPADAPYELYLNDPSTTPEAGLETKVVQPVRAV